MGPDANMACCKAPFARKKSPKNVTRANACIKWLPMLYYECSRLNGLWSPFGFETRDSALRLRLGFLRLNGLWSPFGFETTAIHFTYKSGLLAKWPVEPVRV